MGSLLIGLAAGLRCMTPPAVLGLAAYVGWLSVSPGPFSFLASVPFVLLMTAFALLELVFDKFPRAPDRTAALGLTGRIVSSSFCGSVLSVAAGMGPIVGIVLGLLGGIIGTFGGFQLRKTFSRKSPFGSFPVAVAEDMIAVGLALVSVYFVAH